MAYPERITRTTHVGFEVSLSLIAVIITPRILPRGIDEPRRFGQRRYTHDTETWAGLRQCW